MNLFLSELANQVITSSVVFNPLELVVSTGDNVEDSELKGPVVSMTKYGLHMKLSFLYVYMAELNAHISCIVRGKFVVHLTCKYTQATGL